MSASGADTERASAFRSLQHRNARLFFGGLLVSNVGTWLQMTAMAILVYRTTGRATDLGITVMFQFLPMLVLGAWAGAVADRVDKLRMAILTQSALAVQALVLGFVDIAGWVSMPVVYVSSLVLGLINAFDNPARRGFVTELVPKADIGNAVSLNTAVMTGSRVFGPALAAMLVGPLGTGWCFVLNGLSFAAVLGSLLAMDRRDLYAAVVAPRGGTPVRDALRTVVQNPSLRVVFVVLVVVSTFAFNYNVALPKLADLRWGNENLYGWLLAATSIGSVVGSLATARMRWVSMRWFLANTLLLGVFALAVAWAPNAAAAFVLVLPMGFGGAGFLASVNSITQQESPDDMRGRLMALTAVAFLGSTPIGGPVTGVVGDVVGAEWALGYGALITIAAVAVSAVVLARRPATVGAHGAADAALVSPESGRAS